MCDEGGFRSRKQFLNVYITRLFLVAPRCPPFDSLLTRAHCGLSAASNLILRDPCISIRYNRAFPGKVQTRESKRPTKPSPTSAGSTFAFRVLDAVVGFVSQVMSPVRHRDSVACLRPLFGQLAGLTPFRTASLRSLKFSPVTQFRGHYSVILVNNGRTVSRF